VWCDLRDLTMLYVSAHRKQKLWDSVECSWGHGKRWRILESWL